MHRWQSLRASLSQGQHFALWVMASRPSVRRQPARVARPLPFAHACTTCVQERNHAAREELLLSHLHAAAAHAVRGLLHHRSLLCAVLAGHLLHLCHGRAGAEARVALWDMINERWSQDGDLMGDADGWADPIQELLPGDRWAAAGRGAEVWQHGAVGSACLWGPGQRMPAGGGEGGDSSAQQLLRSPSERGWLAPGRRWGQDIDRSADPVRYSFKVREIFCVIRGVSHTADMVAAAQPGRRITYLNLEGVQTGPAKPLDIQLAQGRWFSSHLAIKC